jgi:hypothetical protein
VPRATRSTGGSIGGLVALLVGYLGYDWFQAFTELQSAGNPFAFMLALFGMGAFIITAGLGIWGTVLLSKK